MPQFLVDREISHTGITEFIIVDDMSIRKEKLIDLGDDLLLCQEVLEHWKKSHR